MRKLILPTALLACASLALAACGGGGGSSSTSAATSTTSTTTQAAGGGGKAQTVDVSAESGSALAFQQKTLQSKAGNIDFQFTNPQSLAHNFCIENSSGQQFGCSGTVASSSDSLSANLKPGTYTYYCNVDSHRQAGMEGTLTVK
jgi:plastocyanin